MFVLQRICRHKSFITRPTLLLRTFSSNTTPTPPTSNNKTYRSPKTTEETQDATPSSSSAYKFAGGYKPTPLTIKQKESMKAMESYKKLYSDFKSNINKIKNERDNINDNDNNNDNNNNNINKPDKLPTALVVGAETSFFLLSIVGGAWTGTSLVYTDLDAIIIRDTFNMLTTSETFILRGALSVLSAAFIYGLNGIWMQSVIKKSNKNVSQLYLNSSRIKILSLFDELIPQTILKFSRYNILYALLGFLVFLSIDQLLSFLIVILQGITHHEIAKEDSQLSLLAMSGSYKINSFFVLGGPLLEEILFRGLLFGRIAAAAGAPIGYIVSSSMFGLMHYSDDSSKMVVTFMNGLVYCAAFHFTGTLYIPIALHIAHNIVAARHYFDFAPNDTFQGIRQYLPFMDDKRDDYTGMYGSFKYLKTYSDSVNDVINILFDNIPSLKPKILQDNNVLDHKQQDNLVNKIMNNRNKLTQDEFMNEYGMSIYTKTVEAGVLQIISQKSNGNTGLIDDYLKEFINPYDKLSVDELGDSNRDNVMEIINKYENNMKKAYFDVYFPNGCDKESLKKHIKNDINFNSEQVMKIIG